MSALSNINPEPVVFWASTVIGLLIAVGGMYQWFRSKQEKIPTAWKKVGMISEIYIYPLKSGRGVPLGQVEITQRGPKSNSEGTKGLRDRFFIVIGSQSKDMKTARAHPKMVLISISSNGDGFVTFKAEGMEDITIKIPEGADLENTVEFCLWDKEVTHGVVCDEKASAWFAKYLDREEPGCTLLYCPTSDEFPNRDLAKYQKRKLDVYNKVQNQDVGAFSDLYSYNVMTESSVDDLNSRLPSDITVTAKRFRPNFVIRGNLTPYEEDNWTWIKINDIIFLRGMPCTRCVLTTVDPDSGEKNKDQEPLKTLKTYRKVPTPEQYALHGNAPVLGMFMGVREGVNGIIRIGDEVFLGSS